MTYAERGLKKLTFLKKIIVRFLILMTLLFSGCKMPAPATTEMSPETTLPKVTLNVADAISFVEPLIEAEVRDRLKIPQDQDVLYSDVLTIKQFGMVNWSEEEVSLDLSDMKHFNNLEGLLFQGFDLVNTDALLGLIELEDVSFRGCATLTEINMLAKMVNLRELDIDITSVKDLSPLQNAAKLEVLRADYTDISDLSALQGKGNLRLVSLQYTAVTDISPLYTCTALERVELYETIIAFHNNQEQVELLERAAPGCEVRGVHGNY